MKKKGGNGPVAWNEDHRVREILAQAAERMNAEKIHPTAIFLALLELVCMFAACDGKSTPSR
jgi:hypothetical protein